MEPPCQGLRGNRQHKNRPEPTKLPEADQQIIQPNSQVAAHRATILPTPRDAARFWGQGCHARGAGGGGMAGIQLPGQACTQASNRWVIGAPRAVPCGEPKS
mmetsp:Transcript_102294/g.173421  ORF Transcript_102294/g.173421 Transcript_102294/m.173421 type:complete len:102 (+) Transcript_102294:819-1124(+)